MIPGPLDIIPLWTPDFCGPHPEAAPTPGILPPLNSIFSVMPICFTGILQQPLLAELDRYHRQLYSFDHKSDMD